MIENSLTYQFGKMTKGSDYPPDALVITLTNGDCIKYVPEGTPVSTDPVFKPGQVVQVSAGSIALAGWYGTIQSVTDERVTVEFGIPVRGDLTNWRFFNPSKHLEIIHEAD